MAAMAGLTRQGRVSIPSLWRVFQAVSFAALGWAGLSLAIGAHGALWLGAVSATSVGLVLAVLVQLLGTVIAAFSARYLEGEAHQRRYIGALAAVLAGVHVFLLADHWLLLTAAWAAVGMALQRLLCFYPDRPFALLAAHKKRIADRLADVMLLSAAGLAWWEVGSGSLSALWAHIAQQGMSMPLQASAVLLVLAVTLRTALLPVHGWLIQVMEAPTPVSALLHAGVVNLGGFVLIRFAPMLEQASAARALLLVLGLTTAVLAGMVMLTRTSIKVRLAWSTVAQMGFMLLECALGLYTLALLHLIGHSLYKAHAFLSASAVVRQTRLQALHRASAPTTASVVLAPVLTISAVFLVLTLAGLSVWPWWWSLVLGLAWAPLLWLPAAQAGGPARTAQLLFGILTVVGLTIAALAAHGLPFGLQDAPDHRLGVIALLGMCALYVCQALLQKQPQLLSRWRRWSYAGFYLDEVYTRLALLLWPAHWAPATSPYLDPKAAATRGADASAAPVGAELEARHAEIERACSQACQAIAPAWPLDRAIAVNPHWSRIGMPVRRVAARMAVLGGIQVFPPRDQQLRAWREGRIGAADLDQALRQLLEAQTVGLTPEQCVDALQASGLQVQLPLLIDVLDNDPHRHSRLSWRQAITHQVSQTCAAYFDEHQASWQPERGQGLYAFWRETLQHDHGIGLLMGLPHIGRAVNALPATAIEAECWVMQRLGLPQAVWADYLESVLLTVNGWASWCAYLGWEAGLAGSKDSHLRELLAIRLAWGALLLECKDDAATRQAFAALQQAWSQAPLALQETERALLIDEVWQLALEIGYQRELAQRLASANSHGVAPAEIEVQAVFCIDVRSEPLRRSLEAVWPGIQTLGFAGFFGLPVAYTPLATPARRPQLPGLLAPTMEVSDCIVSADSARHEADAALQGAASRSRQARFAMADQWLAASRWPGAAFSFVETAGLGYLGKLGNWLLPSKQPRARDDLDGLAARYRPICRPQLLGLDLEAKVALAARVLHAMGLEQQLAPLVLLVGHGSQSANNAHAAALDCGACCGQTGEVNARSLATLLNEPAVRQGLEARGLTVPESTAFVAALHNTTTDEIEGFDLDLLPKEALTRWERLQAFFGHACDQVRRERATRLQLDPRAPHEALLGQLRRRANDGAQTRPEWGLAGNAAFLIAPRHRSLGVALGGRCFLHDYDTHQDGDGSVLELLMTAPMLVTHWINWQYHASTCDPLRLGSGNKVLHNVVGGSLGVFEGNGGDLRIGLSRQSLDDGERWAHEPLRLTVIIDAPQAAIEAVIGKHAVIRQLLDNGWIHLWRFKPAGFERYEHGAWS
ncbi:NADH-quinone oxidoreductase subunit L, partial [Aquabacterium sp.]|uniref:NADH-quinone oxidoreductase subunit L n=1 Tax=Aquabacterium sp. TaxID=1872578 RepID=UPI0025BD40D7